MSPLEALLARLAAEGRTATYGAMARETGMRLGEVTAALEAMMAEDAGAGRPLRAALAEGRLAGGLPARGFFLAAGALGIAVGDPAAFVAAERRRLASRPPEPPAAA
jgi:hypothetical protein